MTGLSPGGDPVTGLVTGLGLVNEPATDPVTGPGRRGPRGLG
ncbi:hypothetical protein [Parafrankia sp. EUN1f]|nr:hypothetical protein [Parafrankia sp. EUN1f]EFC83018.1 hypothetical protein FrEUN1fDRAFT_3871 [Parafrankia sp. EUN1f]